MPVTNERRNPGLLAAFIEALPLVVVTVLLFYAILLTAWLLPWQLFMPSVPELVYEASARGETLPTHVRVAIGLSNVSGRYLPLTPVLVLIYAGAIWAIYYVDTRLGSRVALGLAVLGLVILASVITLIFSAHRYVA